MNRRHFLTTAGAARNCSLHSRCRRAGRSAGTRPGRVADRRRRRLVFEHADKWTKAVGAAEQLRAAGFEVGDLPLDRSPYRLDADLIFLGSFASESPAYKAYMREHAQELYRFVDRGKVLVQMAQADQTEAVPPFLPSTHGAKRDEPDYPQAFIVSPDHPLAKGLPHDGGVVRFDRKDRRTIWEAFVEQGGFEVIVAAEPEAVHPGLMEGAYGQGRIVLAAMDFDKLKFVGGGEYATAAQRAFAAAFFKNLRDHALNVRDRTTRALDVTPSPQTAQEHVPGSWTLAVLPDTQVYALRFPGLFSMQTSWVARNRERLDIRYALHLGDVTNNNTRREWENARDALELIHGRVPLAIVTGNHDHGPSGDASTRDTHFNEYWPLARSRSQPTFGGSMREEDHNNTFHLFEAGGGKWIVVALEWSPRDETVAWANEVMSKHAGPAAGGRRGILITHAYLNNNDRRYDHTDAAHPQDFNPHEYRTPGSKNDGEQLWQKLVRRHDFALVLNGHVLGDGTGYLASKTDAGRTCHQMLSNYQMRALGGEGYLRLVEFRPDGKTAQVKTYSPLYEKYMLSADQQYSFELD